MFLTIKVNFLIGKVRVGQGTLKPLQARRIKKEGGYQLMKNVDHYGCLTKKKMSVETVYNGQNYF